ncbi:MAG TPA: FecR family protein, partial [Polyangia bacterium]
MRACSQARDAIIAVFRQQATEAESLRLEIHLGACQSCRNEKARWRLLEQLRDEVPQRLTTDARNRVLQHITLSGPANVEAREQRTRRFLTPFLLTTTAIAAVAVVVAARAWKNPTGAPPAWGRNAGSMSTAMQASTVENRQAQRQNQQDQDNQMDRMIQAQVPGTLETLGARIAYRSGTSFRLLARARRVELYEGEVDVEVAPGGPGRFRVVAPRFVVEVIGTHFIVRPAGVETLRGTVRILDANSHELAVLHAAESW